MQDKATSSPAGNGRGLLAVVLVLVILVPVGYSVFARVTTTEPPEFLDSPQGTECVKDAEYMRYPNRAAIALHRISKPTIAAVDGVAVGAGMTLALGCDMVIATDRARFSEIFVKRGLTMDFGGTWLLPRLVGLARRHAVTYSSGAQGLPPEGREAAGA